MKKYRLLIAILFLGLVIRCIFIDSRSIQYDDAFSIFLSEQNFPEIIQGTAADTMPPLYYFYLHFWLLISKSITWLRISSIIPGLLIIYLCWLIVKDLSSSDAANWAAFFCAISPIHVYHSQDLRMYNLLVLFQLGFTYSFLVFLENQENRRKKTISLIGMVVFGVLSYYSHNLAAVFLLIPVFYLILTRKFSKLKKLIPVYGMIFVLMIPWLIQLPQQLSKVQQAFWTPRPGFVEIIQALIMFVTNLPLPPTSLIFAVIISILVIILIIYLVVKKKLFNRSFWFLSGFAFLFPIILFIISYFMRPVFVPRAFLVSSVFFFGIIAVVIDKDSGNFGKLIAAAMVIGAAIGLVYQLPFEDFPRSPFQEAVGNLDSDAYIVHDNKLSFFPAHYYFPGRSQVFLADEAGSHNDTYAPATQNVLGLIPEQDIQSAVDSRNEFDFVVFEKTINEYHSVEQEHPVLEWIEQYYKETNLIKLNDLLIYHYEKMAEE